MMFWFDVTDDMFDTLATGRFHRALREGEPKANRSLEPEPSIDCECGAGPFDSWESVLAHAEQWHPDRMPTRPPNSTPSGSSPSRSALCGKPTVYGGARFRANCVLARGHEGRCQA